MSFLTCPKCHYECGRFTEVTEELCSQQGVMFDTDGKLNYDDADCVKNLGETVRLICYECEECRTAFNLVDGKLEEQHNPGCPATDGFPCHCKE